MLAQHQTNEVLTQILADSENLKTDFSKMAVASTRLSLALKHLALDAENCETSSLAYLGCKLGCCGERAIAQLGTEISDQQDVPSQERLYKVKTGVKKNGKYLNSKHCGSPFCPYCSANFARSSFKLLNDTELPQDYRRYAMLTVGYTTSFTKSEVDEYLKSGLFRSKNFRSHQKTYINFVEKFKKLKSMFKNIFSQVEVQMVRVKGRWQINFHFHSIVVSPRRFERKSFKKEMKEFDVDVKFVNSKEEVDKECRYLTKGGFYCEPKKSSNWELSRGFYHAQQDGEVALLGMLFDIIERSKREKKATLYRRYTKGFFRKKPVKKAITNPVDSSEKTAPELVVEVDEDVTVKSGSEQNVATSVSRLPRGLSAKKLKFFQAHVELANMKDVGKYLRKLNDDIHKKSRARFFA